MTYQLRPYQQRAIDQLFAWLTEHRGDPCLVLPTGAGKSIVVAEICRSLVQEYPEVRLLMLTHVKELLEQNAEKLRSLWPGAPMGIYSAGLNRRELGEPITFASVQSVAKRAQDLGVIDICIIDEAHLVGHNDEGSYRNLIRALREINPRMRVIGLTATPYRMGHGLITDDPAIFDDLIEPTSIEELLALGFLAPLKSKLTKTHYDLSEVHKRGGEYIESELANAVDTKDQNSAVIDEVIAWGTGKNDGIERKSWLFFCSGVEHANHVRDELLSSGILAATITGDTPSGERKKIIDAFKCGTLRALTNNSVLTTGFDHPDTDLIAMMRPTTSPGLYCQMGGRGLRLKKHINHCLVLDFAGVVEAHGPITSVRMPEKGAKKEAGKSDEKPTKPCPECHELLAISARSCGCGYQFPEPEKPQLKLRDDDIMGKEGKRADVSGWNWVVHTGKGSGIQMLRVDYETAELTEPNVSEYFTIKHEGKGGEYAWKKLFQVASKSGVHIRTDFEIQELADRMNAGQAPSSIEYARDGKFFRVLKRDFAPIKIVTPEELSDDDIPF